jgi:hypothetical protein
VVVRGPDARQRAPACPAADRPAFLIIFTLVTMLDTVYSIGTISQMIFLVNFCSLGNDELTAKGRDEKPDEVQNWVRYHDEHKGWS